MDRRSGGPGRVRMPAVCRFVDRARRWIVRASYQVGLRAKFTALVPLDSIQVFPLCYLGHDFHAVVRVWPSFSCCYLTVTLYRGCFLSVGSRTVLLRFVYEYCAWLATDADLAIAVRAILFPSFGGNGKAGIPKSSQDPFNFLPMGMLKNGSIYVAIQF